MIAAAESVADVSTWVYLSFAGLMVELTTPEQSGPPRSTPSPPPPLGEQIHLHSELFQLRELFNED